MTAPQPSPGLVDRHRRRIRYLRLSVTDRCNFRCGYCVPEQGLAFQPRAELLTFEEIEQLLEVFVELGVVRVRLTGGEPTVRADVVDLVARLARLRTPDGGRLEVVMTSNGHRLAQLARPLAEAGLRAVNVSLDTLDPDRFRALTGRGDLGAVLAGIDAARAAGLAVKLNAVAIRGENEDQLGRLCDYAWQRDLVVRFIEHMPISAGCRYRPDPPLLATEIRRAIELHTGHNLVEESEKGPPAVRGPARYWHVAGFLHRRVGVISAMSEHFCSSCNRLRLTAVGELQPCLAHPDSVSLRDILRAGGDREALAATITEVVAGKPEAHRLASLQTSPGRKPMIAIGG